MLLRSMQERLTLSFIRVKIVSGIRGYEVQLDFIGAAFQSKLLQIRPLEHFGACSVYFQTEIEEFVCNGNYLIGLKL